MGDLLSAASLLLAVVRIFYGLWYGDISESLSLPIPPHKEDRVPVRQRVRHALYGKALPIVLTSLPSAIIFLPDTISIVDESIGRASSDFSGAIASYDAVRTAFCFVVLLLVALGVYASVLAIRLKGRLREIAR